jgi:SAM-dependent methyltransferase
MKDEDKRVILGYYDGLLAKHGGDRQAVGMGPQERHDLRHQVLSEIGLRSGGSVLDLGCGLGDFYSYLERRGIECEYSGYDINPKMIEFARRKHPGVNFELKDILSEEFPTFDFIVSNAFSLRLVEQDNYSYVEEYMRACYAHARRGVAIDFPSSYADFALPEAFPYSPERVFSLAKRITKRVCLRHDYPLFEFCIYMYPDFEGWASRPGENSNGREPGGGAG